MSQNGDDRYFWLTGQFLENILRSHENPTAKVIDFEIKDAVAKGENYASQLLRVPVKYTTGSSSKEKSFVIKTSHDIKSSVNVDSMMKQCFAREFAFYRDILPRFEKYQNLIEPNFKCAPRCYSVCEEAVYYVFEDLKDNGYRNMDRQVGLDFNSTAMVLRKLAKFHALNAMVYEENPELFKYQTKQFIGPDHPEIVQSITTVMRDVITLCANWPGYEHFAAKLQVFVDNVVSKVGESYENICDDTFKTMTHGDLWVNNLMFKFDETNTPVDVILVDYQIGYYGSPAMDLSYLFYTSTSNEIDERDWDRLLGIYHAELVKSLELVKYSKPIPSLLDIQIQMLKRSSYSVLMTFTTIPPRHLANSDNPDLETLMSNSEKLVKLRHEIFDKPEVRERTQYLLGYFDRKGFL